MGTIAIIGIFGLIVYVGFMLYRLAESWNQAAGQDALAHLDEQAQELQKLAVAKARALRDIKDLEFDYQTGHLTDEDYQGLRQKLERKAIGILQRLDALRGTTNFDALIDREMERRYGILYDDDASEEEAPRQTQQEAPASPAVAPVAAATPAPKPPVAAAAPSGDAVACGGCGHENLPGARFCSQCGDSLPEEKEVTPRFCHDCGHGLEEGARFCASCGTPVRRAMAPVANATSKVERTTV